MAGRKRRKLPEYDEAVTIEKLSHEGRGIATINGKTTFVRGVLPGEEVTITYTDTHGKFDEAIVDVVNVSSPERVTPICAVYGICGGCSLQHMSSDAQLEHKQSVLAEHLQHFGQVEPQAWLPPLQAETQGYRRKARLGVRLVVKKGGVLVGFREVGGRFLTDMQACEVLHSSVGHKITELREWLVTLDANDQIPQLEMAIDDHVTAMIVRHLKPLSEEDLVRIEAFAKAQNWWVYLQPKGPATIHKIYPKDDAPLKYSLPEHSVTIHFEPQDFTQVNSELNVKMVDLALDLLDLEPQDRVLDLFCGLGNFTLPIARYAGHVTGVEGDKAMTIRAMHNARWNDIDNVDFHAADLFESVDGQVFTQRAYNKVLLDPPRAGAEAMMPILAKMGVDHIVYVSCNPATLARDVGILVNEHGYTLEKAGVMDMFPHTGHVESIALLVR